MIITAVIIAAVFILLMIFYFVISFWGIRSGGFPIWIIIGMILIPLLVCIGVITALVQRIKEIQSGEEEAARKY
jgi:fatty acid desaturase